MGGHPRSQLVLLPANPNFIEEGDVSVTFSLEVNKLEEGS